MRALDGMSFTVRPGAVTGFLGPNGAGKTTTMRAIFGLTALDAGAVRWDGRPVDGDVRRRFGYLPEERGLYPTMRVGDQLRFLGRLRGLTKDEADRRATSWLERLGLADRAGSNLEDLSLGNQQRIQLISALVHEPDVLILDEPFSGLDPIAVDALSKILVSEARRGATVLFSSHQLDLVEDLCEDAVIVDRGRAVAQGPLDEITAGHDPVLIVDVPDDPEAGWTATLDPAHFSVLGNANGTVRVGVADGVRIRRRAGATGARCGTRRRRRQALRLRTPHARRGLPRARRSPRRRRGRRRRVMRLLDRPVALVAKREVREGLRSKGFWVLMAISVVAVGAIIVISHFVGRTSESTTDLAVVGQPSDGDLERYEAIGAAVGTSIDVLAVDDDAAARAAVDDGTADLAVLDGAEAIVVDEPIEPDDGSELAAVVNVLRADIALTSGLTEAGLSADEIADAVTHEPPAVESLDAGDEESDGRVGVAVIINIALFVLLQTYGGWVVSGVTREKASRVVEVLLSTVTARQLMFGKIIGIGAIALLHAAVLVATAIVSAAIVGIDVPDGFRVTDVADRRRVVHARLLAVLLGVRRHRIAVQPGRGRPGGRAPRHAPPPGRLHHRLLRRRRFLAAAVGAGVLPADGGGVHAGAVRHR